MRATACTCLLATFSSHEPKQALRDYSISLLLDDSASNVQAYVHRGVLYTQMKWYVGIVTFRYHSHRSWSRVLLRCELHSKFLSQEKTYMQVFAEKIKGTKLTTHTMNMTQSNGLVYIACIMYIAFKATMHICRNVCGLLLAHSFLPTRGKNETT